MREPKVTKELIEAHGLTEDEYKRICEILGRDPNYTELGIFAVMWSEHCSYKSSRVHLKKFPTKAPCVLQGPGENAGAVDIGDGLAAVFKIESHNHPSFIEPYQGAGTGVGGILRDIFTMGARPIVNMNSLRFGRLDKPKNRYLLEGVVGGIAGYGNCMGIPTTGGEIYFEECYDGNPLVNAFSLGIVKKDKIFLGTARGINNPVIYVGSRTGKDGIHGVTMASEEFSEEAQEKRPTVQVGDPFTEKLLLEACLELMKKDYIVGIQDMGGAGLTCSSCETAARAGNGIEIDIDLVPLREEGMSPYEIMLSESQERMLIIAKAGREKEVKEIFDKWDLEAAVIGRVTGDGNMRVMKSGKVVAEIPAKALADEAPLYSRPVKRPEYQDELNSLAIEKIPEPENFNEVFLKILSSLNISSKAWVYEQYDHMVRVNSVVLPGSDSSVIRIIESGKALAMTLDGNSRYCFLDPFEGGKIAVAEAARNISCSGAKPLAVTNCLNFGNPEKPEIMWQFSKCVEGMVSACEAFQVPVISGNVSLYNETMGEAIYPTPVIGMVGIINKSKPYCTQWFKDEGDLILLLGDNREELGGTEYLKIVHKMVKGFPPRCDLEAEKNIQNACMSGIEKGFIKSAHDCSDGGIAIALAESCITDPEKSLGASVSLEDEIRLDSLLFGETQGRIVVSLEQRNLDKFTEISKQFGIKPKIIGRVGGKNFNIEAKGRNNKKVNIEQPIDMIKNIWKSSLKNALQVKNV
ncbi:MAG: phosphoribosylformylglycinamidine synthase II [Candidatus Schekmanbacteria bacterium GWA2_38_9]|uniref:Phosphoribosylformylglycinamidine synthase subunit PurL n=1 Tax=Candidatus Schekmanbacteria bacterium RIFCSPLOWO2_12_FULL_38_15 TaxID=1817883 RepID=A0A1F7SI98_9BACT|nr:MAG: phosphoribosylformylglycinamidine synthase II [Candidatus Schekmanbacteria bacterium GWA2_38_9]OGL50738.1 MAG: phosphoribosylformylglycinamidine synthase II [Candidatus Schekmanbacteria bacterium RIFCSPLOWO2_02_FULL_38_14]OGL53502.1 MAG: phosphoribosylformylglycinamidine synthase II [Candidatus Schekmanbacteria bacterium RIFCSPLOWO2_12_FULL_38_15]